MQRATSDSENETDSKLHNTNLLKLFACLLTNGF